MPTKKAEHDEPIAHTTIEAPKDNTLAIISMVFGLVSLTGPGLLFGIPAIITGSIALKRKLPERGFSITGLVTGIISTAFSLLFILLMIFLMIWGANHPEVLEEQPRSPVRGSSEQLFQGSHT